METFIDEAWAAEMKAAAEAWATAVCADAEAALAETEES